MPTDGVGAGLGEAFGEGDRRVLRPGVGVVDQPGQVGGAVAARGSRSPARARRGPARCFMRGRGAPAEDPPGVGVDDERDVDHAGPGRDVGEVGDPQPVRRRRVEPALRPGPPAGRAAGRRWWCGAACRGAHRPGPRSRISRSTVQRATGDAFAVERQPHLPGAVDAVVRRVHPADLVRQLLVAQRPGRRRPARGGRRSRCDGAIGAPVLGEHRADRLDAPSQPAARAGRRARR